MMHFTCDLCGQSLAPTEDARYVVRVEVFAAHDPALLTDADLEAEPLEALSEQISAAEKEGRDPGATLPLARQNFRYDLCPACHKRFVRDPIGRGASKKLHFSEN